MAAEKLQHHGAKTAFHGLAGRLQLLAILLLLCSVTTSPVDDLLAQEAGRATGRNGRGSAGQPPTRQRTQPPVSRSNDSDMDENVAPSDRQSGANSSSSSGRNKPDRSGNRKTDAAKSDESKPVDPLERCIEIASEARERLESIENYTARFTKRELIGRKMIRQMMDIKFRNEPFSVYMKFQDESAGREVLYVEGQYGNKMLVHESGLGSIVGTMQIATTAPEVTRENKYPINRMGIANMLDTVIKQWEKDLELGGVQVQHYPNAKLGSRPCMVLESSHPEPRQGVRFHITRLYIDAEHGLPVRVEQYGFPRQPGDKPVLMEEYTYANLKPNVGLTNRDFDRRNPEYSLR